MDNDPKCVLKIRFLREVLDQDEKALYKARDNYGESWCKRGGVGAFMMMARKWDRLENLLAPRGPNVTWPGFSAYDILGAIAVDKRPEGVIDDIRDLRRYLALLEAKAMELGHCPSPLPKDNYEEQPRASELHPK